MFLSYQKKQNNRYLKTKPGSALILTMFIMAGMLIIAMSGAYIVLLGIKASGIQSQSTKAYYASESGMERLLWELYYGVDEYEGNPEISIFDGELNGGSSYKVYFLNYSPLTFQSVGEHENTKRSVEVRIVKP